jgi:hypothetical protein
MTDNKMEGILTVQRMRTSFLGQTKISTQNISCSKTFAKQTLREFRVVNIFS